MTRERMGMFKRFRNAIFERSPEKESQDDVTELDPENEEVEESLPASQNDEEIQEEENVVQPELDTLDEPVEELDQDESEEATDEDPEAKPSSPSEIPFHIVNATDDESDEDEVEAVTEEEEPEDAEPVEARFAKVFSEFGGRFVYCESLDELKASLGSLMDNQEWDRVFLWEDEVKNLVSNNKYQKNPLGFNMEKSDVAISFCETLVACEGSIVFSPYQASQRGLQVFPDYQIVLAKPSQVVEDLETAVMRFDEKFRNQLPSRLSLDPEAKNRTVEGKLVLKCSGSTDVYVFLCEEL